MCDETGNVEVVAGISEGGRPLSTRERFRRVPLAVRIGEGRLAVTDRPFREAAHLALGTMNTYLVITTYNLSI